MSAQPGALHPVGTVARVLDLSERKVQDLARNGIIPKAKHGQYDLIACVQGYIRHLRAVAAGHTSQDGNLDLTAERARLAKEQADAQELKNAQSRGELVPAADVEAAWVKLFSAARLRLLAVPSKVAPLVIGLERAAEVEAVFREHQTEALQELADTRVQLENESGEGSQEATV